MKNTFKNIDDYIFLFPEIQEKLDELRKVIHSQNPDIEEYIGYQMPAFRYKKKPFTLQVTKSTSDFIPEQRELKTSKKNLMIKDINFQKALYNFL